MQLLTVIDCLHNTIKQKTEYLNTINPNADVASALTAKFLTVNLVELNNILAHLLKVNE